MFAAIHRKGHPAMPAARFPDAPPQIRALPLDPRGYPVPWFVGRNPDTGERDFRIIYAEQVNLAAKGRKCWICGRALGEQSTFTIGPMCTVNRVSSEPPAHLGCARFAVRACPFLTNPQARRDPRNLDTAKLADETPGIMIQRNPGVTALWRCRRWKRRDGLFNLGEPTAVEWFAQGRPATRSEVLAAFDTGLPTLEELTDNDVDRAYLATLTAKALALVPAHDQ
jgi:hypothetical protein